MDDATAKEIIDRLVRLETKLDKVLEFTDMVQSIATPFLNGGRGKLLSVLARPKGGGS
jgi:hypothetical protein